MTNEDYNDSAFVPSKRISLNGRSFDVDALGRHRAVEQTISIVDKATGKRMSMSEGIDRVNGGTPVNNGKQIDVPGAAARRRSKSQRLNLATTTMRMGADGKAYDTDPEKPVVTGPTPGYDKVAANFPTGNPLTVDQFASITKADDARRAQREQENLATTTMRMDGEGTVRDTDTDTYHNSVPAPKPADKDKELFAQLSSSYDKPISELGPKKVGPRYPQGNFTAAGEAAANRSVIVERRKRKQELAATKAANAEIKETHAPSEPNPYNADGSVKPEYNDPSSPLSTTMREVTKPRVGIQKDAVLAPAYESPATSTDRVKFDAVTADLSRTEEPESSYEEGPVKAANEKPQTPKPARTKLSNEIPLRAIDIATTPDKSFIEEADEQDRNRGKRGPMVGASPYTPNTQTGRATAGKTDEAGLILAAKRALRSQELAAQGKSFSTHQPHVVATARGLAAAEGVTYANDEDLHSGPHMTKAYVLHSAGVASSPEKLDAYLGKRPAEAKARLNEAYEYFQDKERNGSADTDHPADTIAEAIRSGKPLTGIVRNVERGKTVELDTTTAAPAAGTLGSRVKERRESRTTTRAKKRSAAAPVRPDAPSGVGKGAAVAVATLEKLPEGMQGPRNRTPFVTRPLSAAEEKGKADAPTTDDSKNLVPTSPKSKQWEQVELDNATK